MYRLKSRAQEREPSGGSLYPQGAWVLVEGDDVLIPQVVDQHATWEQMQRVQSTLVYTDPGFPPGPRAVDGREEVEARLDIFKATMSETSGGHGEIITEAPLCQCGQPARMGTLRREGTSNGRPFWRCAGRVCKFFELADRASTLAAIDLTWTYLGPPKWVVVGDEGFRPEHLRQGAVGDCWFMSALAVVAERHDLLEKLLPNLNEGLQNGCHEVRLFLDGWWTSALIDSHFPMANSSKQRRKDETGLAFGRASEHQLWVPLIEKAYARAHGAYNSISGGQVSEAMLDLTGCPTESVDFRVPGFDKDLFWGRLLSFLEAGFPVGCGTSSETVEDLGLVGQHAYSVLEASERPQAENCFDGVCCLEEKMVKVRNPWGEWTRRENDDIMRSLGAAITDDGAFWMRYEDFIKGFANADICKAQQGWHARSFEVGFVNSVVGTRRALRLRTSVRTECYIMLIQPTDRGARLKRARGYYLNDFSLALLNSSTGAMELVVLGGARRDVMGDSTFLHPDREYVIIPFSFKARPGSCVVRVFSANPVEVHPVDQSADHAVKAWKALHTFAMVPQATLGTRVQRMVHHVYDPISGNRVGRLLLLEGESLAIGILCNEQPQHALEAFVLVEANHMVARTSQGLIEGNPRPDDGAKKGKTNDKTPPGATIRSKREPKDAWHEFSIEDVVAPSSQQLLFVMIPCMRQKGDYDLSLVELHAGTVASTRVPNRPPEHAFSAVQSCQQALESLPGAENVGGVGPGVEDDELMLAISASLEESQVSQEHDTPTAWENVKQFEEEKDPESLEEALDQVQLLAAIAASLNDASSDAKDKNIVISDHQDSPTVEDDVVENNALELALAMSLSDATGGYPSDTAIAQSASAQSASTGAPGDSATLKPKGRWGRHKA